MMRPTPYLDLFEYDESHEILGHLGLIRNTSYVFCKC